MSIFTEARVAVLISHYAEDDGSGRVNALGVGFRFAEVPPNGAIPPQSVVALIDVPAQYVGQEFSMALTLRHLESDQIATIIGSTGGPEAVRLEQVVTANPPEAPHGRTPPGIAGRVSVVLKFGDGIPLQAGRGYGYRWVVEIDGQENPAWSTSFHVVGDPAPPVNTGLRDYVIDRPSSN